jgi:hypothetical protein
MKERIEKLISEAIKAIPDHVEFNLPKEFTEKFAELIVQECDHLIQQQVSLKYKDGWEQDGITDDWAYGHYTASILSRAVIKRHFGVEE